MRARERAWDASGLWCGDGPAERRPALAAQHQRCERSTCGRFICSRCERCMPACWGTSDPQCPTWCDECWAAEERRKKRRRANRLAC